MLIYKSKIKYILYTHIYYIHIHVYIWVTDTQEKKCSQYQDWGDDSVDKTLAAQVPSTL